MIVKNPVQARARAIAEYRLVVELIVAGLSGRIMRLLPTQAILRRRSTNRLYVAEESKLSDESLLG